MTDGTEMQDSTLNEKDLSNVQRNTNKSYSLMFSSYPEHWLEEQITVRFTTLVVLRKMTRQPQATTAQITQIKRAAMNSTEKFQHCKKLQEKLQG